MSLRERSSARSGEPAATSPASSPASPGPHRVRDEAPAAYKDIAQVMRASATSSASPDGYGRCSRMKASGNNGIKGDLPAG